MMTFEKILRIISEQTQLPEMVILARGRKREIVDARSILIYHTYQNYTLKKLAMKFETLTHPDIIFHRKRYCSLYSHDATFRGMADKVSEIINIKKNTDMTHDEIIEAFRKCCVFLHEQPNGDMCVTGNKFLAPCSKERQKDCRYINEFKRRLGIWGQ